MTLLVIHAGVTWFMVGLIWTIQSVHYPLFALVGADSLPTYEAAHTRRVAWLLSVPAAVEVLTGAALVWARPPGVSLALVLLAGAILAALWVVTALVQVPLHRRLTGPAPASEIERLVRTNWLRTGGWTLRGVLVAWLLGQALAGTF